MQARNSHDTLTQPGSGPAWGAARRTGAAPATAFAPPACGASTPVGGAAAKSGPHPAWIGPHAGDRSLSYEDVDPLPDRGSPTTELLTNWSRRGAVPSPRGHGGLDSSGPCRRGAVTLHGVEPAALLGRIVGTERFLGRRRYTATVAGSDRAGGRTPKSCWVLLGCRVRHRSANHPGAA